MHTAFALVIGNGSSALRGRIVFPPLLEMLAFFISFIAMPWRCGAALAENSETGVRKAERVERIVAARGQGYFPVMIKLKDRSLGAVIRGGAPHIGVGGRLDWIRSEDGGRTWSKPAVIVDSKWDDRNPSLGQMADGTIVVGYAEASTYDAQGKWDTSAGAYELFYVNSHDNGKTWSPKNEFYSGPIINGSAFGRIIHDRHGTALMAIYGERNPLYKGPEKLDGKASDYSGIIRSRDNGRTWGDFSLILSGHNEASLQLLPDGRLIAVVRTEGGALSVAESSDDGYHWSLTQKLTREGQHPADICLLKNGRLLVTYGNRLRPYGVGCVTSSDRGRTWNYDNRVMLAWDSENTDCGYPSTLQLDDGTILTMYYSVGTKSLPGVAQAVCLRYGEAAVSVPSTPSSPTPGSSP